MILSGKGYTILKTFNVKLELILSKNLTTNNIKFLVKFRKYVINNAIPREKLYSYLINIVVLKEIVKKTSAIKIGTVQI